MVPFPSTAAACAVLLVLAAWPSAAKGASGALVRLPLLGWPLFRLAE